MNDTETKNTAVKAPALMSTRPVTAQDALDQCEKLSPMIILLLLNETVLRLKYSVLVEPQIFKKNSMLHQIAPSCRKRKRVSGTKMVEK